MDKIWLKHYPEHIQREIEIPDESISDMLQRTISNYGDHSAIYF